MGVSVARLRTRILAISDEVQLQRLLRSILEPSGCRVFVAAKSAAMAPSVDAPDIVILDLDRLDSRLVSQARRVFAGAEVIAVCNAYSEVDCVAVLEMGVDYLARPFRAQNLSARVRAAEIRHLAAKGFQRHYRFGPLDIDLIECTATCDGRPLPLSRSELLILTALARRAGGVAAFRDILSALGRTDSRRNRQALHAFVHALRGKIESDPQRPAVIVNEARVGYRLAAEPGGFPSSTADVAGQVSQRVSIERRNRSR
jgi:two-component system KDP operon response regulator KdpE